MMFNQLYDFAIKNDICNKDYSTFVDVVQYKNRNPNKYDRNKFEKEEYTSLYSENSLEISFGKKASLTPNLPPRHFNVGMMPAT